VHILPASPVKMASLTHNSVRRNQTRLPTLRQG
jgi:hypothetical protein